MIQINEHFIGDLIVKASKSERKRCTHNFHPTFDDPLQRMLNVMKTGTYVRPHKHENPDKREVFIILKGKVLVVEFDDTGNPLNFFILFRGIGNYACEISPKTWHTIVCLEDDSVLYEVKDGPYDEKSDKKFAGWAPEENSPQAGAYLHELIDRIKWTKEINDNDL